MLIVIKSFAEDQSDLDSPEPGSPMSSSSELERNQKNLSWMTSPCLGQTHHGVFRKSVEHAFRDTLYASCLFFPVHLSWKRK